LYGHIIGIYRRSWGRGGRKVEMGKEGKGRRGKRGENEVLGSQGKVRRGREGNGDCGIRVVIKSDVSKSSAVVACRK